jgi:hypothetical protein
MRPPTPLALILAAALLAGAQPARALSGDQESACGAILCLVGGAGVAECAGYLARYFAIAAPTPAALLERRLDFLNLCPTSGLPGDVRPMLATYGATCQPERLVRYLNNQLRACEMSNPEGSGYCRPTGNEWRICAPFYEHAYTSYAAPRFHEQCQWTSDGDGYVAMRCSYTWTVADPPPAPGS